MRRRISLLSIGICGALSGAVAAEGPPAAPPSLGTGSWILEVHDTREQAEAANEADPFCRLCNCDVTPEPDAEISRVVGEDCSLDVRLLEDRSTSFTLSEPSNPTNAQSRGFATTSLLNIFNSNKDKWFKPKPFRSSTAGLVTATITTVHLTANKLPAIPPESFPPVCNTPSAPAGSCTPSASGVGSRNIPTPLAQTIDRIRPTGPTLVVVLTDGFQYDSANRPLQPSPYCEQQNQTLHRAIRAFLSSNSSAYLFFLLGRPISGDCSEQQSANQNADKKWLSATDRPETKVHPNYDVCPAGEPRCTYQELEGVSLKPPPLPGSATKNSVDWAWIAEVFQDNLKISVPALREHNLCDVTSVKETRKGKFLSRRPVPISTFDDAVLVGNEKGLHCTGVVVGSNAVLTAGHCLPASKVFVGESAYDGGQWFSVSETLRYPLREVDAALLRTSAPLHIEPRPRRTSRDTDAPLGNLRFVGFGATDTEGRAPFGRRKVLSLAASDWGCSGDRIRATGCLPDWEMIIPGIPSGDTCSGDSGGPVYEVASDGKNCGFRLIGITSRRMDDSRVQCGQGGIYVRVDRISDWLKETIDRWKAAKGS